MTSLSGAHVLVTGAAGFIGAHLCHRLLAEGARVTGCDNLNPYYDPALKQARLDGLRPNPQFSFHQLELSEAGALSGLWRGAKPDYVVHLAAQAGVRYSIENPRAYAAANLDGFLEVLEAARETPVRHLVYASSSSVYGANTKVPFSERDAVEQPVSLYAATKRANELMAQTYAHLYRIPATGLRFFTVYGPLGRPDMAYWSFTKALFSGAPITVFNHGQLWRDFTYIDEIVEAIALLATRPPAEPDEPGRVAPATPHRIFNIGNDTPVKVDDFLAILEKLTGRKANRRDLPMQPGDVERTWADVSALRAAIGFAPRTPLEEGLRRFVEWFRQYHQIR
ncbi:NAD-dependent epimerase/dehydratase family protein [Roseomonas marmotae]|uniref:NAD-dependent epimerase/dehydratase family protein n=1 Tax=Roseomonas marmotae TaxID=2768161 RepID=A0ABS3K8S9_9PROT|nr:NAD-dependent epimerase/dehydratase family protein [Roseomonas marmotae]MBO1073868.1 NAD-dependent epimerase/dehydratase family protein [Roseomonas marmotae]QTI78509.1 NAD-dependent epimerase/dehydratase family protein [Roseomonas marmotae]